MSDFIQIINNEFGTHLYRNTNGRYVVRLKPDGIKARAETISKLKHLKNRELSIIPENVDGKPLDIIKVIEAFPKLVGLEIDNNCVNLEAIYDAKYLDSLSIRHVSNLNNLKLGQLKKLKCITFDKTTSLENLGEELSQVEALSIWHISKSLGQFEVLSKFPNLKWLTVAFCELSSLEGLCNTKSLLYLDLAYLRKLKSLRNISYVGSSLLELSLDSCREIEGNDGLNKLANLRSLYVANWNQFVDLKFCENLELLESFLFSGVDVKDGNISRLFKLKNLKSIVYTSKKHFDVKLPVFEKMLKESRKLR